MYACAIRNWVWCRFKICIVQCIMKLSKFYKGTTVWVFWSVQRLIQNPVKYLRWAFLRKLLTILAKSSISDVWLTPLLLIRRRYSNPAGIYLLKVNNRSTRTRCEICSKLTIKTPERRHWPTVMPTKLNVDEVFNKILKYALLRFFLKFRALVN